MFIFIFTAFIYIKLNFQKYQKSLFSNFLLAMHPSIENFETLQSKRKPRAVSTFLKKTYGLLNDGENSNCVRWAPNGIGFIVTNEDLFSRIVLPKYFKHSNYSSFVRQLNMYNFHKLRQTNSENYFHHECFDRDNKNALAEIKRKPEKKKRKLQESEDEQPSIESTPLKQKRQQNTHYKNTHSPVIESEYRVSIKLIRDDNEEKLIKSEKNSTKHMFSETCNYPSGKISIQDIKFEEGNGGCSQKILSVEDDDKLSINDDIAERIPRFNTKELFYPSTNNLFPIMGNIQPSTFSLFF